MARKEESLDVDGGGSTIVVRSTYVSAEGSPDRGGLNASPIEDSTLRHLELAFNYSLAKKGGTYMSYDMDRFKCRKVL